MMFNLMVALMGASMVNAHMIMSNPTPYSKATLNNSPLAADGSDFPCKLRDNAFEAPATETILAVGENMKLAFEGSAIHGGGSCQISLTKDLQPSKSSSWQVIKSFEGGCPALNSNGDTDLSFKVPEGISAGKYTLAWTWFNRIGNREMYMNCAPITVTGGSSKRSNQELEKRAASFPPLFVANVNGCTTTEMVDIRFPNPGEYIDYLGVPANLAPASDPVCKGTPTFGGAGLAASGSSSSSSSGSNSGSDSGSSSSSAVVESTPSATASASESSSVAAESTPTAAASASADPAPEASASSEPSESPKASLPAAPSFTGSSSVPSSSSSSSSGALTGTCKTEGEWNCIAGTSFQRCAQGTWSATQQMASGTECGPGQSADFTIMATKKARHISSMRFRKRNLGSHHV
ncbi:uncharacterized protein N7529_010712 [Penicillium soppii]|uniref:uncharacterized protein n=1 Tax=Penicillium soppii TaxID=69789 RepID=UPI0025477F95|nr:uncharacterized protein N7529_010712 [Penicillium soppii]KAJ5851327.1 hypothetical protein N7529_010712 [Penicillium soppii]